MRRRAVGAARAVSGSASGRHLPAELSGGEQQRVAIARALLTSRSSCSPTSRPATSTRVPAARCCALLGELNEAEDQTLVMVSHDPAAAATAGRVVFLRDGRVAGEIAGGSTERVVTALAELDA